MDLEDRVQEWERSTIAESLQQLWVQMMNISEDASAAANLAHLSHLTPLDEYTRSLGKPQETAFLFLPAAAIFQSLSWCCCPWLMYLASKSMI